MFDRFFASLAGTLFFAVLLALPTNAADGPGEVQRDDEARAADLKREREHKRIFYANAEALFVATIDEARITRMAKSFPPIYSWRLKVTPTEVIRGDYAVGKPIVLGYSSRHQPQLFWAGKPVLITAATVAGDFRGKSFEEVTDARLDLARFSDLPIGWRRDKQKAISPWAVLGEEAFPRTEARGLSLRCAVTGRPAWRAGGGVRISVKPVPPKQTIESINPDGDGAFTITVTNITDKPLAVPALLHDASKPDKPILWSHSVLILCQDKTRLLPGTEALPAKAKPTATTLKPGQSVSTVINVLRLKQVDWPRDDDRIRFHFAIGQHRATQSMYYVPGHHDELRKAAAVRANDSN